MEKEIFAQLILGVLGGKILRDPSLDDNREDTLIKALLYMIYLSQDDASPVRQFFIQELLTSFPALRGPISRQGHPLTADIDINFRMNDRQDIVLTIHERHINRLAEEIDNGLPVPKYISRSLFDTLLGQLDPPPSE